MKVVFETKRERTGILSVHYGLFGISFYMEIPVICDLRFLESKHLHVLSLI